MKEEIKFSIPDVEKCPICGLTGKFIPPPKQEGKKLIVTFICPASHEFTKFLDLN